MPPFIVSVEGNIGSGKSTLIECLKSIDNLDIYGHKIIFLPEPVEDWQSIKDKYGKNMIEKFYKDQHKYAFPFQFMAYISRLAIIQRAINENPNAIIITERCLYTDKNVFCTLLFEENKIEDVCYSIYNRWFDHFIDKAKADLYIYLRADPVVSNGRIKLRNREGENIPLGYLVKCNEKHETWLNKELDVMIIDGNQENGNHQMDKEWSNEIINTIRDYVERRSEDKKPKYIFTENHLLCLILVFCITYINYYKTQLIG